ncbi:unnamed protein product [Vicia faba]|uniref:Uncharacterized protein n=1 Tax=Vicia faba TaxID=3906 RepID=A0AAV1A282_VICFA|nr:unnamed protein product [Vicia faba]
MLQYHFALDGDSLKLKNRLKLFKSIWPTLALHDELMDCHSQCIDNYSLCQSFNIINHVVAKISLCKRLLFHDEEGGDLKEVALEMQSNLKASRIHFINVLVKIWQLVVQKFSLSSDQSGTGKSTSTFTFPIPPSLESEPPKSSNKPKIRVIYQMESNNPYEILDDDDGFDWEAAAREIDAVCQMRSGAKTNESELEKVCQKREKRNLEKQISLSCKVEALSKRTEEFQELLNQEEQKSASAREKLNFAVRKGKSLLQQRDSLKQTIGEMNVEMEHLKSEINKREHIIAEHEQKMRQLLTYPDRLKALESESSLLKHRLEETEHHLQEKEYSLKLILNKLGEIDVAGEGHISDPVKKLEWIGKLCSDLHNSVASFEQKSRKSKRTSELLLAELNEVQERNDSFQEEIAKVADELVDLRRERDSAEAAKLEALSHVEKLSTLHEEEKTEPFL